MKNSLVIGKPFGITIAIHWTFLFLIAFVVAIDLSQGLNYQQILLSVLFVLALFVCVVLHELGHSITAQNLGGEVKSITLLPIGGMANIKKMPDKPKEEFLITIAGLAVNVVIALILWLVLNSFGTINLEEMDFKTINRKNFFVMLMAANLFVVVFNLVPAFPMDGGRILRSLLSFKMTKLKATRIAKTVGKVFAVLFVILGLFYNPFLVVIGIFVYFGAQAEYRMIKYHDVLNKFKVKDILQEEYTTLHPDDTLEKAANQLIHGSDNGFIVVSEKGFEGTLTKEEIINGLANFSKQGKVKDALSETGFRVKPDSPLPGVYQEMIKNKYSIIPVFSDDKLTGVLELENIQDLILVQEAVEG